MCMHGKKEGNMHNLKNEKGRTKEKGEGEQIESKQSASQSNLLYVQLTV